MRHHLTAKKLTRYHQQFYKLQLDALLHDWYENKNPRGFIKHALLSSRTGFSSCNMTVTFMHAGLTDPPSFKHAW